MKGKEGWMDGPTGKEGGREGWTEKGKGIASYPGPREGPCIHCLHMHSHPTFCVALETSVKSTPLH